MIGLQCRPVIQREAGEPHPVQHGKQVGIGHGEPVVDKVAAVADLARHIRQWRGQCSPGCFLGLARRARCKDGGKALVQLGRCPRQPFHRFVAFKRAGNRRQRACRGLVGHVLQDDLALGEQVTIFQRQRRHIALGIDGPEIVAAFGQLGAQVDALAVKWQAGGDQGDTGRERAGAGAEVEFHGVPENNDEWQKPTAFWRRPPATGAAA